MASKKTVPGDLSRAISSKLDLSPDAILPFLKQFNIKAILGSTPLDGGIENQNLRLKTDKGEFVLRVYSNNRHDHARLETEIIKFLYSQGVPVALPIEDSAGCSLFKLKDHDAALFRFIEGAHVTGHPMDLNLARELAKSISMLQSALAKYPKDTQIQPPDIARFDSDKEFPPDLQQIVSKWFMQIKKTVTRKTDPWIHSDLTRENILAKDGKVAAFLDFDDLHQGPIIYDTAVAITQLFISRRNGIDWPGLTPFLEEYLKHCPIDPKSLKDIIPWMIIRNAQLAALIRKKKESCDSSKIQELESIELSALAKIALVEEHEPRLKEIIETCIKSR